MINLQKNHKLLSASESIKQICKPLQHLTTHLFTYMKNFNDGTQINISSDPRWIEDYYALKLYNTSYFENHPSLYQQGFKWWTEGSDLPIYVHGRDYFNSHYGITYCQQVEDGCEFFFFSGAKEHPFVLDFYLNNLDLLEKFSQYFKDHAVSILKECNHHRIIREQGTQMPTMIDTANRRNLFLQETGLLGQTLASFLSQFEPLTRREYECLLHSMKELSTAEEVAAAMNISRRTVETHLERIKSKLQCRSKNELMVKLISFYAENK